MVVDTNAYVFASIVLETFALLVTGLLLLSDFLTREQHDEKSGLFAAMLLVNAAALACDMITWICESPQYMLLMYAANFFVFALGYVMTAIFTTYLSSFIATKDRVDLRIIHFVYFLSGISVALVILSLFNRMYYYVEDGRFHAGDAGWLSVALSFVAILADMILMFRHRNEFGKLNTVAFLSYGVFPMIAFVIQMIGTELTVTWIASTLTMLLIYLMVHVGYMREYDRKKVELSESRMCLAENQRKLMESQTALMLSQIQPHFLYNSLTVVDQLIRTDPVMARKALADFSMYLRGNLSSLNNELIPFSDELRHIRAYLELEQMRYGKYLHVVYDIQAEDFDVPALSVQPLVENAVQHGLADQKEGGTVMIKAGKLSDQYEIVIMDDGAGFIPGETKGTGAHIGIENIRTRLALMCGGELTISSEKGKGTKAVVKISRIHTEAVHVRVERMGVHENRSSR